MTRYIFAVAFSFILIAAFVSRISAQRQAMPPEIAQAEVKISRLVDSHPEPLVHKKLLGWLKSGRVQFAANNVLPEMSASLEQINGKGQVLLWYNYNFLLQVPQVPPADKDDYLRLVLYHEAVHIDDHFAGRLPLGPIRPIGPMSFSQLAQATWDKEWSAVSKEWALAKKIQKPYLVPMIYNATRKGENRKSFLEGFYQLQMTGNAVALNHALGAEFTARYKKELAKLLRS
jgi:hypothetical protein